MNKHNDAEKYCVVHYLDRPREFWDAGDHNILSIPNCPDFEPVKLVDNVPSIIKESAYIIAQGLLMRMPSLQQSFAKPKRFKFWLMARYLKADGTYDDKLITLFANIASAFGQFGAKQSLINIYRQYTQAIIDEVCDEVYKQAQN